MGVPKIPKAIAKALKDYNNEIEVFSTNSVSGGCINEAFHYVTNKGDFFVKINKSNDAYDMFMAESKGLEEINRAVPDFGPKPIYFDYLNENKKGGAFLITTYIHLTSSSSREIQVELAKRLAKMHTFVPLNLKYGFSVSTMCGSTRQDNFYEESWVEFLKKRRFIPIIHHCISVSSNPKKLKEKGDFLIKNLDILFKDYVPQPGLIHGDLWSGNWGVNSKTGKPVIFDPAVTFGDHEYELGIMRMFGGFGSYFYEEYFKHFPKKKGFEMRMNLYELYHHLNHMHLFGSGYESSAMALLYVINKHIETALNESDYIY
ncbi:Ketosamine-3-kinase [Piromyces finnis]|uniref:protein-ribulosamine 3-kinase n=1 Tax=Piromyces finnis TaxID=1754191 RepID=A0A1Y1VEN4_9FUNG|nr:Ketosamine-3-kinase [Piromyces finnis]|eukprot:ORX54229.1 Ketosamine-3-kinase [Piromyces finnis]